MYRDVIKFSSSPKVVDLSELNRRRAEAHGGKVWMPKRKTPVKVKKETPAAKASTSVSTSKKPTVAKEKDEQDGEKKKKPA